MDTIVVGCLHGSNQGGLKGGGTREVVSRATRVMAVLGDSPGKVLVDQKEERGGFSKDN